MSSQATVLSAAVTASGTGSSLDLGGTQRALAYDVSLAAVADGTSVDVRIEHSHNGSTWVEVDTVFGLVDTLRRVTVLVDQPRRFQRAVYTLTGTAPGATIRVRLAQGDSYLSTQRFASIGLPGDLVREIPALVLADTLETGSGWASSLLGRFYVLPIVQGSLALERAVASVCAYDCLCVKGYSPTGEDDSEIRKRYEDAIAWLNEIALKGDDEIVGSPDNSKDDQETAGSSYATTSLPRRGWRLWPIWTSSWRASTSFLTRASWVAFRAHCRRSRFPRFNEASRRARRPMVSRGRRSSIARGNRSAILERCKMG